MRRSLGPGALLALGLSACTPPPSTADATRQLGNFQLSSSFQFPDLAELRSSSADPWVEDAVAGLAVSRYGSVATFSNSDDGMVVMLFDSAGHQTAMINRQGEGPGEFRRLAHLSFVDSTLYVSAPGRPAVLRFSTSGEFLGETRLSPTSLAILALSDSVADVMSYDFGGFESISLEEIGNGKSRTVLTVADSFVMAATTPLYGSERLPPAYVRTSGFLLIGNGRSYRIGVYDEKGNFIGAFGRDLPLGYRGPKGLAEERDAIDFALQHPSRSDDLVRARLDTLGQERISHFGRDGLGLDYMGRIWVMGRSGDSTFADVFADTVFLGRHVVPCLRSVRSAAVNGRFLALRCADEKDDGYRIRLYKITG